MSMPKLVDVGGVSLARLRVSDFMELNETVWFQAKRQLIDDLDEAAREVLDRLATRTPVGRTRDAAPGTPADRPVQRLLAAGLLRQVDAETVVLPRDVRCSAARIRDRQV